MNPNDIKKIAHIALEIDHKMAFGGKSAGNQHLSRVVKIALFLGKKLGANMQIVEVAAYIHDSALPTENDDNYVENKKLIEKIFADSGVSADKDFISKVAEAAASHEGTVVPQTLEAKIVHDADVIEKTGLLGIIRHTWKLTNHHKINPDNVTDEDIKQVTDHIAWRQSVLQTELVREMASKTVIPVSLETLRNIVPTISKLASQGVITEEIAQKIEPLLSKEQVQSLKNQLSLTYLI